MADKKLLVIISTSEKKKALAGMMYAYNSLLNGWMKDVKLFLFGSAEKLLLEDEEIQHYLNDYLELAGEVIACKFISDKGNYSKGLQDIGVRVEYVGEKISQLINSGYVPMVW